jgi:hypothetical protein
MRAIGWCLKKLTFFTHIRNPRWPPMQDLIGKVNNSFFLEKTNMIVSIQEKALILYCGGGHL